MIGRLFGKPTAPRPASRDTDADWRKLGRDEPYFGVLADPRFLRANLTPEALEEFYETGRVAIERHLRQMRGRWRDFAPASALDFGCGVGRLTAALAEATGDAFGVDIAPGMLAEARKRARPGLAFGLEVPERMFDWLVSIIVLQHIPPPRGYAILRDLLAHVAPGGGLTLQLTVYRDARHADTPGTRLVAGETRVRQRSDAALATLPEGEMTMFDYDLSIVFMLLNEAGITQTAITHTDHGGFHGALILGRKRR